MNDIAKVLDRARKLLAMTKSENEHEAATAAERVKLIMAEYNLTEAMLRLDEPSKKAEPITKMTRVGLVDTDQEKVPYQRKRVAWKCVLAMAVARSLGCEPYYQFGEPVVFGRESACQAWSYTVQYLWAEVERLVEAAWTRECIYNGTPASIKRWKNAFRVGCAQRIATRLHEKLKAEEKATEAAIKAVWEPEVVENADEDDEPPSDVAAFQRRWNRDHPADQIAEDGAYGPQTAVRFKTPAADIGKQRQAIVLVHKDHEEVEAEYKKFSKGFRTKGAIGQVSSRTGYDAGREAGGKVALGGGRGGLPAGQGRLNS